mmetsp:Transcript_18819/g.51559  ORF Transcript_18819/g.51559 Transcript_18819/m.51559 type:complete len:163 (+) Transcript_18819:712-1200(+)
MASTLVFGNVDPPAGLGHFIKLASESNHIPSMVAAGVTLIEGIGVIANIHEGEAWLKKAADLGSSQAAYELGCLYYYNEGSDNGNSDADQKAVAYGYFCKAIEIANDETDASPVLVSAIYMKAACLLKGQGVEPNYFAALALLQQAAELGHVYAQDACRQLL